MRRNKMYSVEIEIKRLREDDLLWPYRVYAEIIIPYKGFRRYAEEWAADKSMVILERHLFMRIFSKFRVRYTTGIRSYDSFRRGIDVERAIVYSPFTIVLDKESCEKYTKITLGNYALAHEVKSLLTDFLEDTFDKLQTDYEAAVITAYKMLDYVHSDNLQRQSYQ